MTIGSNGKIHWSGTAAPSTADQIGKQLLQIKNGENKKTSDSEKLSISESGTNNNEAKIILGPYYDVVLAKHEENPNYFAHPDNYIIFEGEEYKKTRAEYTTMVNSGQLEPGHHILGVADGGQNIQSNITYTGEKFLTRNMLPQDALDYYDSVYGRPNNPHPKRIAIYEEEGIVYFGKNPKHTEATNLQQEIHEWQKANGYRRK